VPFVTCDGKRNGEKFVEFLNWSLFKADNPVYLIVDGHPVHESVKTEQ
jgi:hypothetical protein